MPMQHSVLGASGTHRWFHCPGSVRLIEQAPEQPSSHYAAEGTVAHAVCEASLKDKRSPEYYVGLWGNEDGDRLYESEAEARRDLSRSGGFVFEVTDEMAEAVKVYHKTIMQERRRIVEEHGQEPEILAEKQLSLEFIKPGMFGTNDASVHLKGKELIVVDYKHGQGVSVEVEDNPQLNYYALGALADLYGTDFKGVPDMVTLIVVQPRANHPSGPVRRWTTTSDYLINDFAQSLRDYAEATEDENAPLKAGDWCRFCAAKPICPELEREANRELEEMQNAIDLADLEGEDANEAVRNAALQLTPDRLKRALDMAPLVETWIKSINGLAQSRMESGVEVRGYKLVRKRSVRRWKDEDAAVEELSLFVDDDKLFTPPKLKSPAQIEKIKDLDTTLIDSLTEKPDTGLTVVPESDPKPAVTISIDNELDVDEL